MAVLMAVRITRKDKSAGELRQEAARCRDGKAARRMLAIALVLDGVDRKTAAENCGMDRQTLRDWAHRYNAEGVSGLFNRRPPDPPCLLSAAQKEELAEMVRAGPDPETDGVVRWRRIDLKRKIEEAVLHQSPDKRGVPLPVKMVSQLTQTWHSQVRSFC